ncbi:MAG: DUF4296 domain-containing protein [Lunatimonas sp.]|uniref:DUF4296 domain-containing protein n=1 Tax=Lunatimonas sp. TaxID=2060141 RepID=UPI002A43EBEF|nr:DUF4296 domain-containing protein [Lunatimonas sp.]
MKYSIWLLAACCFCFSCSSDSKPPGLLSEDEMVSIIVDIHLTEGFVQSLPIPYDSSKKVYPILEKEIFEKHRVADTVYMASLQYYLRYPAFMERVYARAIDSLTVFEKRAESAK